MQMRHIDSMQKQSEIEVQCQQRSVTGAQQVVMPDVQLLQITTIDTNYVKDANYSIITCTQSPEC
jgi:hypothetical protein